MSPDPPSPEPGVPTWRLVVTGVAVVLMAAAGYIGIVLASFTTYPTCVATPPPGPPAFLVSSAIITVVCGAVPALCFGVRRGQWTLVVFALGAIVPLGCALYVASRTGNGFCL